MRLLQTVAKDADGQSAQAPRHRTSRAQDRLATKHNAKEFFEWALRPLGRVSFGVQIWSPGVLACAA